MGFGIIILLFAAAFMGLWSIQYSQTYIKEDPRTPRNDPIPDVWPGPDSGSSDSKSAESALRMGAWEDHEDIWPPVPHWPRPLAGWPTDLPRPAIGYPPFTWPPGVTEPKDHWPMNGYLPGVTPVGWPKGLMPPYGWIPGSTPKGWPENVMPPGGYKQPCKIRTPSNWPPKVKPPCGWGNVDPANPPKGWPEGHWPPGVTPPGWPSDFMPPGGWAGSTPRGFPDLEWPYSYRRMLDDVSIQNMPEFVETTDQPITTVVEWITKPVTRWLWRQGGGQADFIPGTYPTAEYEEKILMEPGHNIPVTVQRPDISDYILRKPIEKWKLTTSINLPLIVATLRPWNPLTPPPQYAAGFTDYKKYHVATTPDIKPQESGENYGTTANTETSPIHILDYSDTTGTINLAEFKTIFTPKMDSTHGETSITSSASGIKDHVTKTNAWKRSTETSLLLTILSTNLLDATPTDVFKKFYDESTDAKIELDMYAAIPDRPVIEFSKKSEADVKKIKRDSNEYDLYGESTSKVRKFTNRLRNTIRGQPSSRKFTKIHKNTATVHPSRKFTQMLKNAATVHPPRKAGPPPFKLVEIYPNKG